MFYDELSIYLKAGNGGDGSASFRREKYVPRGGPDGGNGGRGGNLIIECDVNHSDLRTYHFNSNWIAKNGDCGHGRNMHGRGGDDLVLKFPAGTVFTDKKTGKIVAELTEHEQTITLLKGGKGGKGNTSFKSSTNQTPYQFTEGTEGEEAEYDLEVKVIADVGLVGFPNAGKSTLIGILTNASPKTAPYPFTTKDPSVGLLDDKENFRRIRVGDIPGLIEGASENKGLGHQFLRHIERCKLLVILIDIASVDQRVPFEDYQNLLKEMGLFSEDLLKKPRIAVLNKTDLLVNDKPIKEFNKKLGSEALTISCADEEGMRVLIDKLFDEVNALS